ncbi:hypothetical protein HYALB_00004418 [Hymenoscyphus albidus]|uniref:Adenosine deaminase domain-containing protein n=1 Tax=Hymenoscyphus albidus TaxID=595503 RepID=A0A9N9Q0L9_9HELO|nr:hypothetical protein HYALB_00004418 [Hymenoscyphus albidus]
MNKTDSTYEERQEWRQRCILSNDSFMMGLPKIELHVHIEGTMSADLRWRLSVRNGISLTAGSDKTPLSSLEEVREAYKHIRGRIGAAAADAKTNMTFYEAYYGGFDLLQTEGDYYDLAMGYFERASQMQVRYCEPFFDPQGHTRRGIPSDVMMRGFKRAQDEAESRLKARTMIKSQWIMCILRDLSPESAMAQYEAMLLYKSMVVGIGLDSDEFQQPPSLFQAVFKRARADGFKLTTHCDFNQKNTHEHILQVAKSLGGNGAERIDHGMNAADHPELMQIIREKGIGMTICPCAYIRHTSEYEVFPRIRKLFDAGIQVTIASDDSAYMEDNWIFHNLYLVREKCEFTNGDLISLQRNAVSICWTDRETKIAILDELATFEKNGYSS